MLNNTISFSLVESLVSDCSDCLRDIFNIESFDQNDWLCSWGLRLTNLEWERQLSGEFYIYADRHLPHIEEIEDVILCVAGYRYQLPLVCVPSVTLGYLENLVFLAKVNFSSQHNLDSWQHLYIKMAELAKLKTQGFEVY